MATGRPRSYTTYYTFDDTGSIIHIFASNTEPAGCDRTRKYKSLLSFEESILLCRIMKNFYNIDSFEINPCSIPDKLKFLKFPPKKHSGRLSSSWNVGKRKSRKDLKFNPKGTDYNKKIDTKKRQWLYSTFSDKVCAYCHESENSVLLYHPNMKEIAKINSNLGVNESRSFVIDMIESQEVRCLNCNGKIQGGHELIKHVFW
jgi:hypothetical protein